MFLYAWDHLEEGKSVPVGADETPELPDLLAKVLIHGINHLLRRGLSRGYAQHSEDIASVRGRIDMSASMKFLMNRTPRLVCEFDELDPNILPNCILRTTVSRLARTRGLDAILKAQLHGVERTLRSIDRIRLNQAVFHRVQLNRNNSYYGFLMKVCELAFLTTLPDQADGSFHFDDVLNDDDRMASVFQAFIRNFYAIEQIAFKVAAPEIAWDAIPESDEAAALLPTMRTDIVLSSERRQIIIDTKYYASALKEHHGKRSLQSSNLYQLFSYLKNAEVQNPKYADAEGILLYPATGTTLRASYSIQGHRVTAATVNLDQPWQRIYAELKTLVR